MFKKALGITILLVFAVILIFGAVNRTQAKNSAHETSSLAAESNQYRQAGGLGAGGSASRPGIGNRDDHDQQPLVEGNPQAEVDSWIGVEGTVTSVDSSQVFVSLLDGSSLEIAGRAWSYAQENGFSIQNGDRLRLTGFFENNELEVGSIENLTQGVSIQLREQSGRPLWAGRGRQG